MSSDATYEGFMLVQKNRNACIHWLLQFVQQIEKHWADEALRTESLGLLRKCLETCQTHAHPDVRELGALAPRMLRRLDFDQRHFLNLMLPFERKHSKGVRDHEFLEVTTEDRPAEEAAAESGRLPLTLVLDHLRSAFNVGAIFRTADCIGVSRILACGYTATPDDSTVQKTSLGAWEHVPWEWRRDAVSAIDELQAAGIPVIALETVPSAPMASEFVFPRSGCALLLGNERHGCSPELLAKCDAVVRLPARGVKNSMNVGVALGMCGYEITRQWTLPEDTQVTTTASAPEGATTAPDSSKATATSADMVPKLVDAANALAESGDFGNAAVLFRRAADLDPCCEAHDGHTDAATPSSTCKAMEGLAQCLLEMDDATSAVAAATAAVQHAPEWALGWLTLGRAELNSKHIDEALRALRRASVLDPSLSEEAADDVAAAERLQLQRDAREMILHDRTKLLFQEWRDGAKRIGVSTTIWESGIVLAKLLDRGVAGELPDSSPLHGVLPLLGRRVVELGSGTGVVGLAAAALGATVALTDMPDVLPLIEVNVKLNEVAIEGASGAARVEALRWEHPDDLSDSTADCDIVLAADLIYQRDGKQLGPLCDVLRRLLAPSTARPAGGLLLLAHKARHTTLDESLKDVLLERAGVSLTEIPYGQHHEDFRSTTVKCFVGRCVGGVVGLA